MARRCFRLVMLMPDWNGQYGLAGKRNVLSRQEGPDEKFLLMSAAAVLAGAGSANATTYSFVFGTAGGGSHCDGGTINTNVGTSDIAAAWTHTNNNCASGTSQGAGLLEKVKGLGKVWVLSDNLEARNYAVFSEYTSFTLSKAIKTGGKWTLWVGFSGVSSFEANTGTLNKVTAGARGSASHGTTSTAATVRQLVVARSHQS